LVQVKKIETEQEFQEVVDWWNYQREREIFHRWGHLGRTLDSMFPLPEMYKTRREETETALRPYFTGGEVWVCRDKENEIRHAQVFLWRPEQPDLVVSFWGQKDWDYAFTIPPDVDPDTIPPPVEDTWWEAPKASPRARLRLGNPYEAYLRDSVFSYLEAKGVKMIEFRDMPEPIPFIRRVLLKRTPLGYDKWIRKQRYRVLVDLVKLREKRGKARVIQERLSLAEAL